MTPAISIVIPVFNETDNVQPLHAEIVRAMEALGEPFEVLFIDDGSSDGSPEKLEQLAQQDNRVGVIRLARNFGQTAAMAAGFAHARGDVIVAMDADGQNDPADIGPMLKRLRDGYDVVAGWRYPRHDSYWTRLVPSMMANALIGRITGVRLHDYGCTLKVLRREVVQGLRLYGEMHRFIPALADDVGARIAEVVVHHRPRRFGTSKYGLSRTIRVILDLITVKFMSSYSTRPIQVFGVVGLVTGGIGALITALLGFERIFLGIPLANRPIVWLGILLVLMGMQFITMGLLGELLVRTYHESQGKPVYRVGALFGAAKPSS